MDDRRPRFLVRRGCASGAYAEAVKLILALVPAVMLTAALSACSSHAADGAAVTSPAPTPANLAALATLRDDFPAGLPPVEPRGPEKVDPKWASGIGETVSYGKPFTVDPPQCRALLKPVEAQPEAERAGIGAGGPQEPLIAVRAVSPVTVPDPIPTTGCDRIDFVVDGALPDGTAVLMPAPVIDGATTFGLRVDYRDGVEYFYTAIVDDHTYVRVTARMAPDFQPEPLLPDLLTKAVTAIRTQN